MAGRIGLKSMANFSKQAAVSLNAGLALTRAIPLISGESRDARLRSTFQKVNADISAGETLAAALRRRSGRFPPIFVEMVGAGERTGHLGDVFGRLADYFDMRVRIRWAFIKASIYPGIQLFVLISVVSLLAIVWSSDKVEMATSIVSYLTGAVVAFGAVYLFFSKTSAGRNFWYRMVLWLPIFRSLTIKLNMARFTRTLAMQLESAIPMTEAIERSAMVAGNGVVADSLSRIADPIRHGSTLNEAVQKSKFMSPMIREVLAVGEETGNFGESLNRVADIYEEESLAVLESLPKFIGPIVVILVGVAVGYLIIRVYYGEYIKPLLDMVGA